MASNEAFVVFGLPTPQLVLSPFGVQYKQQLESEPDEIAL